MMIKQSLIQKLCDTPQIYATGKCPKDNHGIKSARKWRKLHIVIHAGTGEIGPEILTDQNSSDNSQLTDLLERIDNPIATFKADGAYDSEQPYRSVRHYTAGVSIIVPLRTRQLPTKPYGVLD